MTPNQRKTSAAVVIAASIAMPAEGLRQVAYKDTGGITTICYGHTQGVKMGDRKTLAECMTLLSGDMVQAIQQVDLCHPGLPVGVLAAFGDAVFNLGPTIACDGSNSTASRFLAKGMLKEACEQLPRWNKIKLGGIYIPLPGLTKRRAREMEICLKDVT